MKSKWLLFALNFILKNVIFFSALGDFYLETSSSHPYALEANE